MPHCFVYVSSTALQYSYFLELLQTRNTYTDTSGVTICLVSVSKSATLAERSHAGLELGSALNLVIHYQIYSSPELILYSTVAWQIYICDNMIYTYVHPIFIWPELDCHNDTSSRTTCRFTHHRLVLVGLHWLSIDILPSLFHHLILHLNWYQF